MRYVLPVVVLLVSHAVAMTALYAENRDRSQPLHRSALRRNAYFGDLHLHTKFSFDAYLGGPREIDPDLAYRFARGLPVSYMGQSVKRRWPLDFAAVTDHAEYIGVLGVLDDPESTLSESALGQGIRSREKGATSTIYRAFTGGKPFPFKDAPLLAASAWQKEIDAANRHNSPGVFTTFIGYEWTSFGNRTTQGASNLHRNVIFRGNAAPFPFTSIDSTRPEDLWTYLEHNRRRGIEALAIPHNANWSNGLMYDWNDSSGVRIGREYAVRRSFNEPLAEITQTKGQSETNPLLAPEDELADFEVRYDFLRLAATGRGKDGHGSSIREAYGRGLIMATHTGANPFKFGVVGGSDFHNGLSTSDEDAYSGHINGAHSGIDPTQDYFVAEIRKLMSVSSQMIGAYDSPGGIGYDKMSGSGGLTGVWADENTRESIYDALRRRETFATSGTRLRVRFFGSWSYSRNLVEGADFLNGAYDTGVPMGSDLPSRPPGAVSPRFLAVAVKDPEGANLDRIQVIKVWIQGGTQKEKVFDIAWSDRRKPDQMTGKLPAVGNTVAVRTAAYTNSIGSAELKAFWEDPEFDPAIAAAYYLRALEIPTPRWTTIQSARAGISAPTDVPASLQERAWSSPIWYERRSAARQ